MLLLIAGVLIWAAAHFFKRLAPDARARMGEAGKGLVTVLLFVALIAMIVGYRGADFVPLWSPPPFFVHLNNLAMLLALWVLGSSMAKGAKAWPATRLRHPQLVSVKIWAAAHLLVNGDLASVILFGGMLGWAVISVILINRAEPSWTPPPPAGRATYLRLVVITVVMFAVIAGIHLLLGVRPFS